MLEISKAAALVVETLRENKKKIAFAESCTGGGIAAAITSVSGSSEVFDCGIVSYSNEIKESVLGVSAQVLADFGAVSAETAAQMVLGVMRLSGADLAISVTGIAGPDGGSAEKPVGLVYIALADSSGVVSVDRHVFSGDRAEVRAQTVASALLTALNYIGK